MCVVVEMTTVVWWTHKVQILTSAERTPLNFRHTREGSTTLGQ